MALNNYIQPYSPYQPTMYNPIAPYQARLDQMQQQYQQMQPMQPMQSQAPAEQQNIICRPVASIDEARAVQTDFSGALMVFPDISHGMIHTKRLDYNTGSAAFNTYRLDQPAQSVPSAEPACAPVAVIEYAPIKQVQVLEEKIAQLEKLWGIDEKGGDSK